jgi:hypothetical protein
LVSSTPLALHNIGNSMPHTVQHPITQFTMINIHFEIPSFFFNSLQVSLAISLCIIHTCHLLFYKYDSW